MGLFINIIRKQRDTKKSGEILRKKKHKHVSIPPGPESFLYKALGEAVAKIVFGSSQALDASVPADPAVNGDGGKRAGPREREREARVSAAAPSRASPREQLEGKSRRVGGLNAPSQAAACLHLTSSPVERQASGAAGGGGGRIRAERGAAMRRERSRFQLAPDDRLIPSLMKNVLFIVGN